VSQLTFEQRFSSYRLVQILLEKTAMLTSSKQSLPEHEGIDWLGIEKTFVVQIVILLAASVAVLQYINWSSRVAQAEFARAIEPIMLDRASPYKSLDPGTNSQTSDSRRAHM
jgi:hypothetical protein